MEIKVNTQELRDKAVEMGNKIESYRGAFLIAMAAASKLNGMWDGPAAEAFEAEQNNAKQWYERMANIADSYKKAMISAADSYERADNAAKSAIG